MRRDFRSDNSLRDAASAGTRFTRLKRTLWHYRLEIPDERLLALIELIVQADPQDIITELVLNAERMAVVVYRIYRLRAEINVEVLDFHSPTIRNFSFYSTAQRPPCICYTVGE